MPLLAAGHIDLIIGRFYEVSAHDMFVRQELWIDPMAIVARAGHPVLSAETLNSAELSKYELILPVSPVRVAAEIETLMDSIGLAVAAPILSTSYAFTREILLASDAFTILPPMVLLGDLNRGSLGMRALPVDHGLRSAGVITVRDRKLNEAAQAFIACLQDNIAGIVTRGLATIGTQQSSDNWAAQSVDQ